MNSTLISVKQALKNHLKNKMPNQIIKEYPIIRKFVLTYLELEADQNGLMGALKEKFIIEKYHSIKINGLSLEKIEEKWLKLNSTINTEYKILAGQLNKMNIFPQKTVKLFITDKELEINVIDTGKKYIPNDAIFVTEEIIDALSFLKEQENIEFMTNVFVDGHKALNLTDEDLNKIRQEIIKKIHENTNSELEKNKEFDFNKMAKRTH